MLTLLGIGASNYRELVSRISQHIHAYCKRQGDVATTGIMSYDAHLRFRNINAVPLRPVLNLYGTFPGK